MAEYIHSLSGRSTGVEVAFQQEDVGCQGVQDTYISQWAPDTNYSGRMILVVRQGDYRAGLVRFDLSALPAGATIHEAGLELYAVTCSNGGGLIVEAYPVTRPWAEGQATWERATWSENASGQETPEGLWQALGCNAVPSDRAAEPVDAQLVNTLNEWHIWDVTSVVQDWVDASGTNQGIILKGAGPTSVEYGYATSDYWWALDLSPRPRVRYLAA